MQRNARMLILVVVVLMSSCISWGADVNLFSGKWKFNPDKSKPGDRATILFEPLGPDGIKFTREIVEAPAPGHPAHWEWSGQFDGKEGKFTGSPNYDAVALRRFDDRTIIVTNKKGGKVMTTAWYCVSKDGKLLGVTTSGVNAAGKDVVFFSVYDKQ
jgi:hypothetical protein